MGASGSVLTHASAQHACEAVRSSFLDSCSETNEARKARGVTSSLTLSPPLVKKTNIAQLPDGRTTRVDLSSYRLSNQLHLLLYARTLFDDLVSDGEAMDVEAFSFFIQEVLCECSLDGKHLKSCVIERLSSGVKTKLIAEIKIPYIRWNEAESILAAILADVTANSNLFDDQV